MTSRIALAALLLVLTAPAAAQQEHQHPQPYAGEQKRAIKALPEERRQALLAGEGMGFAQAAELNHYPGPRHVLELSKELGLSAQQSAAVQRIFDEMQSAAKRLGAQIVERERELDALFEKRAIDVAQLHKATARIARLEGALRAAHLEAHLRTAAILSAEQIQLYDRHRGYSAKP